MGVRAVAVTAKFTCTGYTTSLQTTYPHKKEDGTTDASRPESVEMRSVKFAPVYANNDPKHENSKFWNYTPMGSIDLGTINPGAWQHFEIGKEYYVDFSPATAPVAVGSGG